MGSELGRRTGDRGGHLLEYAVVFVLVAALFTTVSVTGIGEQIANSLGATICHAVQQDDCESGGHGADDVGSASEPDSPPGSDPDPGLEPLGYPGEEGDLVIGPAIGEDGYFEPLGYPGLESVTVSARTGCVVVAQGRCAGRRTSPGGVRGELGVMATSTDIEAQNHPSLAHHVDYATGEEDFRKDITYWQWAENTQGIHYGLGVDGKAGRVPVSLDYLGSTGVQGDKTYSEITISERDFDAIQAGEREPPNPFDPRSLPLFSSIYLEEESFLQDTHMSQAWLFDSLVLRDRLSVAEGDALSAEVYRLSDRHVAVTVGETETFRSNSEQSIGFEFMGGQMGTWSLLGGPSFGRQTWRGFNEGTSYTAVLDIGTEEGWDAYQEFVGQGELPEDGSAGVEETYETTTTEFTEIDREFWELFVEAGIPLPRNTGKAFLGATGRKANNLGDFHFLHSVTTRDDGSAQHVLQTTQEEVTTIISTDVTDRGHERDSVYSFLLQDVGPDAAHFAGDVWDGQFESGDEEPVQMQVTFTEQDLQHLQDLAIQFAAQNEGMTTAELREYMESERPEDGWLPSADHINWGEGDTGLKLQHIAYAQDSAQIMEALRYGEGWTDSDAVIGNIEILAFRLMLGLDGDPNGDMSRYMVGEARVVDQD